MGRLIYGMNTSLDGYIAGPGDDISWSGPDDELHWYWNDAARQIELSLYGRRLWDLMSAYWPTADQDPDVTPVTADFATVWRATPKVVFSSTLTEVSGNARLERGDVVSVARELKETTDGDIEVAGATLAAPLVLAGLVDEYRLVVTPAVIGAGKPFFPPSADLRLRLIENRRFAAGAVLLRYEPIR